MMELTVSNFLWVAFNNFFIDIFTVRCWEKCINHNKITKRTLLVTLLTIIMTTLSYIVLPKAFRIIITFIFLIMICYYFITKSLKNSIVTVIISQLITWINEFSFAILISIFYKGDVQQIVEEPLIFLSLNIYIFIISFVFLKLRIPQKLFNTMINIYKYSKNRETLIYSLIIIAMIIISTIESYMKLSTTIILLVNISMAIIFITIVIMSSKTKAKYNKISSKYQTSISSLKEYEVMINQFSMYSHENRNEFYTVRNMLRDGEKRDDVIKYIDALINNKIKDNEKIMKKTAKIPSGGLRATIYSKLCLMDELNIKHTLSISRDVKTTDLIELDEALVLKICNILGVFLDNAIDAVKNLKKKEISVEIYIIDEYLCIDITNNFKGNLNLDKISEEKYTTKGDGHGYGLTLVNQILNEELGKLENERSINRDTFTQTLKIKM